jgi:hypothetical protein
MANQRKKGIERVTLTMPDEMLNRLETEALRLGKDRLALMREVLAAYLNPQLPKSSSSGAKPKKGRKGGAKEELT